MWSRNCLPLLSAWIHPRVLVGSCCSIFRFLCSVLDIIVCPFVFLRFGYIALSVRLRFTASVYSLWYLQTFLSLNISFTNQSNLMFNPIKKQQLLFNCSHEIFAYLFVNRYDFMILSYKWMTLCWRNYEDINLTLSKAYINSDSTSNVSLTRTFKLSTVKYQWLLLPFNSILLDVYFSDLWFFMVMFCFVLFLILLVCFCFRCFFVR